MVTPDQKIQLVNAYRAFLEKGIASNQFQEMQEEASAGIGEAWHLRSVSSSVRPLKRYQSSDHENLYPSLFEWDYFVNKASNMSTNAEQDIFQDTKILFTPQLSRDDYHPASVSKVLEAITDPKDNQLKSGIDALKSLLTQTPPVRTVGKKSSSSVSNSSKRTGVSALGFVTAFLAASSVVTGRAKPLSNYNHTGSSLSPFTKLPESDPYKLSPDASLGSPFGLNKNWISLSTEASLDSSLDVPSEISSGNPFRKVEFDTPWVDFKPSSLREYFSSNTVYMGVNSVLSEPLHMTSVDDTLQNSPSSLSSTNQQLNRVNFSVPHQINQAEKILKSLGRIYDKMSQLHGLNDYLNALNEINTLQRSESFKVLSTLMQTDGQKNQILSGNWKSTQERIASITGIIRDKVKAQAKSRAIASEPDILDTVISSEKMATNTSVDKDVASESAEMIKTAWEDGWNEGSEVADLKQREIQTSENTAKIATYAGEVETIKGYLNSKNLDEVQRGLELLGDLQAPAFFNKGSDEGKAIKNMQSELSSLQTNVLHKIANDEKAIAAYNDEVGALNDPGENGSLSDLAAYENMRKELSLPTLNYAVDHALSIPLDRSAALMSKFETHKKQIQAHNTAVQTYNMAVGELNAMPKNTLAELDAYIKAESELSVSRPEEDFNSDQLVTRARLMLTNEDAISQFKIQKAKVIQSYSKEVDTYNQRIEVLEKLDLAGLREARKNPPKSPGLSEDDRKILAQDNNVLPELKSFNFADRIHKLEQQERQKAQAKQVQEKIEKTKVLKQKITIVALQKLGGVDAVTAKINEVQALLNTLNVTDLPGALGSDNTVDSALSSVETALSDTKKELSAAQEWKKQVETYNNRVKEIKIQLESQDPEILQQGLNAAQDIQENTNLLENKKPWDRCETLDQRLVQSATGKVNVAKSYIEAREAYQGAVNKVIPVPEEGAGIKFYTAYVADLDKKRTEIRGKAEALQKSIGNYNRTFSLKGQNRRTMPVDNGILQNQIDAAVKTAASKAGVFAAQKVLESVKEELGGQEIAEYKDINKLRTINSQLRTKNQSPNLSAGKTYGQGGNDYVVAAKMSLETAQSSFQEKLAPTLNAVNHRIQILDKEQKKRIEAENTAKITIYEGEVETIKGYLNSKNLDDVQRGLELLGDLQAPAFFNKGSDEGKAIKNMQSELSSLQTNVLHKIANDEKAIAAYNDEVGALNDPGENGSLSDLAAYENMRKELSLPTLNYAVDHALSIPLDRSAALMSKFETHKKQIQAHNTAVQTYNMAVGELNAMPKKTLAELDAYIKAESELSLSASRPEEDFNSDQLATRARLMLTNEDAVSQFETQKATVIQSYNQEVETYNQRIEALEKLDLAGLREAGTDLPNLPVLSEDNHEILTQGNNVLPELKSFDFNDRIQTLEQQVQAIEAKTKSYLNGVENPAQNKPSELMDNRSTFLRVYRKIAGDERAKNNNTSDTSSDPREGEETYAHSGASVNDSLNTDTENHNSDENTSLMGHASFSPSENNVGFAQTALEHGEFSVTRHLSDDSQDTVVYCSDDTNDGFVLKHKDESENVDMPLRAVSTSWNDDPNHSGRAAFFSGYMAAKSFFSKNTDRHQVLHMTACDSTQVGLVMRGVQAYMQHNAISMSRFSHAKEVGQVARQSRLSVEAQYFNWSNLAQSSSNALSSSSSSNMPADNHLDSASEFGEDGPSRN